MQQPPRHHPLAIPTDATIPYAPTASFFLVGCQLPSCSLTPPLPSSPPSRHLGSRQLSCPLCLLLGPLRHAALGSFLHLLVLGQQRLHRRPASVCSCMCCTGGRQACAHACAAKAAGKRVLMLMLMRLLMHVLMQLVTSCSSARTCQCTPCSKSATPALRRQAGRLPTPPHQRCRPRV